MPLLLSKQISQTAAYAVWKISETNARLEELHGSRPALTLHPRKSAEWMAARMLVKNLCSKFDIAYKGLLKDTHGKPHLVGSEAHVSISHSFPMASAMINLKSTCGIDVEWPRKKIVRIQDKFLNVREHEYKNRERALSIIWAAKEAVYKKNGKKYLSFKDDIVIEMHEKEVAGKIITDGGSVRIPLRLETVREYLLVYSV